MRSLLPPSDTVCLYSTYSVFRTKSNLYGLSINRRIPAVPCGKNDPVHIAARDKFYFFQTTSTRVKALGLVTIQ